MAGTFITDGSRLNAKGDIEMDAPIQSFLGSLSILRMAPHWSVKRLTSCSHGNNKQK